LRLFNCSRLPIQLKAPPGKGWGHIMTFCTVIFSDTFFIIDSVGMATAWKISLLQLHCSDSSD
jgi:hypothetical protein